MVGVLKGLEQVPVRVWVSDEKLFGVRLWLYQVRADGVLVDEFTSREPLTHSELVDVAAGYREALTRASDVVGVDMCSDAGVPVASSLPS